MTKKPILNFVIDPADLKRLDDFRHKHRFPTRAAACKWILGWALKQAPRPDPQEVKEFSEWRGGRRAKEK